jgi:DNA polymerase III subunit delta'
VTVWDDVVGQESAVAILQQAVRAAAAMVTAGAGGGARGLVSPVAGMTHAWLLTGPPGSGRSTAARAFAAALQCLEGGCGHCHACLTSLSGAHADVTLVATEHVQLRVDDVRPLIMQAQRSPSEGRWRVIVIEDADRLNDSSGNVLLKAIEEPPPRTVWLLCAPSADDVLTTIRSRCRRVGLRIPPVDDVAALLIRRDGADPAVAAFAARSAQSHIGLARRLALDEGARIRRREVLRLPAKLRSVGAAVLAAGQLVEVAAEESKATTTERDATEKAALLHSLGAEGLSTLPPAVRAQVRQLEENQKRRATRAQRDVLDRSLVDLLSLYRDVLVLQMGAVGPGSSEDGRGVELVNAELADLLWSEAQVSTPDATLRRMEAIGQARERIEANVSPLLAVEALMVQLRPAA